MQRMRKAVFGRRSLVLGSLMGLAACHFAPPHAQPPLPTPPLYDASLTLSGTAGARASDIGWRDFFQDPRLDALIAAALEYNRDLRIAVGRIDVARGQYRIQNADRIPTAVATGGITRTHSGSAASGANNGVDFTLDRGSISVGVTSFELDFWGRVRSLSEAARSDYLATVQAQRAFKLSLIQDVAAAYFAQIETAEQIRLADTTVLSRREV